MSDACLWLGEHSANKINLSPTPYLRWLGLLSALSMVLLLMTVAAIVSGVLCVFLVLLYRIWCT